jgi:phosphatidylinositol-4-phosphate 5-kinase-like protein 1
MDGPENRYFLGIVDFLTRWCFKQRMHRVLKVLRYGCITPQSTVPPLKYSRRFVNFVSDHCV